MNAKRFSLALVVACLMLSVAEQASAYYAAHIGRWLTRDPNGEIGRMGVEAQHDSQMTMGFVDRDQFDPLAQYQDGMNLYAAYFAPGAVDPFGLSVSCSDDCPQRPVPGWAGIEFYGCYCGRGNQPGPGGNPPTPIDPVDVSCEEHDDCYGAHNCVFGSQDPACVACDRKFCRDLKTSTCNRYGPGTHEFFQCEAYKRNAMIVFGCEDRGVRPPRFPNPFPQNP
jgi:hypothetical protein